MTEIQGAIGRLQLRKLERWVEQRRTHAERFAEGLADIPALRIPVPSAREYHSYYKYYSFVNPERLRPEWNRDRILAGLDSEGCPGWSGSCPEIYREHAFANHEYPVLPTLFFEFHGTERGVEEQAEMIGAIASDLGGGGFQWATRLMVALMEKYCW